MTVGIGIYTGGNPFPYPGSITEQLFTLIGKATYTSVVIWAAHINSTGDITINDCLVADQGAFKSEAQRWATQVAALKTNSNSTITRVELSIGGDSTQPTSFA